MNRFLMILMTAALAATGCNGKGDDTSGVTGDATAGATVYANTCAACHNDDGSGQEGYSPSLVDEIPDQTDDELTSIIQDGYGDMPAQNLSEQDLADVIAYCREQFPG